MKRGPGRGSHTGYPPHGSKPVSLEVFTYLTHVSVIIISLASEMSVCNNHIPMCMTFICIIISVIAHSIYYPHFTVKWCFPLWNGLQICIHTHLIHILVSYCSTIFQDTMYCSINFSLAIHRLHFFLWVVQS